MLIAIASAATIQSEDLSENITKNLKFYIIAGVVIVCVIIALLCYTAAKGCCCL
jgi:hypothetical protein